MSQPSPNKKNLGAILLTLYIDLAGFSIIFPLFPGMLDYYFEKSGNSGILAWVIPHLDSITGGGHYTAVLFGGVLGSLYSIMQFIFSPIWGGRSDRLGRKSVLKITLIGTAASYLIWLLSGSFELFVAGRILGGIMAGNISVATAAVADMTTRENRSKGMAMVGAVFGLGFITGPAIGAFLSKVNPLDYFPQLEAYGINPFSTPALISLILAIVNYFWLVSHFKESLDPAHIDSSAPRSAWKSITGLISIENKNVRNANWVFFVFIAAFSGMEFTLTFFAAEKFAYSPAQNGYIFLYIGFLLVLIQGGLVRRLAPKIGERPLSIIGIASGLIAFLVLSQADTEFKFYVSLTFMSLAGGFVNPGMSALVSLYSPANKQGANIGLFRSAGSLARAVGPITAAGMYWYFNASAAYLFAAIVIFIPLYRCFLLPNPNKDEDPI